MRPKGVPLQKVTLNLLAGDKDTLCSFYTAKGWTVAARDIIHDHCVWLREKDSQEIQKSIEGLNIKPPSLESLMEVQDDG